MNLLLPFDIVPTASRVPQDAFGVAPASERAVRYAFGAYGRTDDLQVTVLNLAIDAIDLEGNLGAAEIRAIAAILDLDVEICLHPMPVLDSTVWLLQEVLDLIDTVSIDPLVMLSVEGSFVDAVFSAGMPARLLADQQTPVPLVP